LFFILICFLHSFKDKTEEEHQLLIKKYKELQQITGEREQLLNKLHTKVETEYEKLDKEISGHTVDSSEMLTKHFKMIQKHVVQLEAER